MITVMCVTLHSASSNAMAMELSKDLTDSSAKCLDVALFEEAAEYALRDFGALIITKVQIELGSSVGENFLGLIYRAKVHLRQDKGAEQVLSCIVKCIPNTAATEFLHESKVFLKELIYYRDVLPQLEVLCIEREKFGAKLYHTRKQPFNTLIFEDLSALSYNIASRQTGLDEAHCLVVLRKLGKFHAMSMLLAQKDPKLVQSFNSGLLSRVMLKHGGVPFQYYSTELAILETIVRAWPGCERIADKLLNYQQQLHDRLLDTVRPAPGEVCVLSHGDLWVNNILFKYQPNGQPADALFVDFQMSVWCSLGLDINYFFYTSAQLSVLQLRRAYLLRAYYESLSVTLARHNYQSVPTLEQVQREVRQREAYGFFAAFGILPLVALGKEAASDNSLDNLADKEFARQKIVQMYAVPRVQEVLKYSLKRFDELGVFD